mgnify:CR=1 FL=1
MFRRVLALLWLRLQIIISNKSILLQVIMPFAFVYFYKYLLEIQGDGSSQQAITLLAICLPFSLALAVGNPITVILSEEKEKHNLRTLLISGVKGYEYLVSTLILPLVLTVIVSITIPLILKVSIEHVFNYSIVILLTSFVIILIYLFIGLITRSQVEAQVIGVPAMLLVSFLPMLANIDKNISKFVDYSFMGLFTEYVDKWQKFSWGESIETNISLILWALLLIICNYLAITKKILFN